MKVPRLNESQKVECDGCFDSFYPESQVKAIRGGKSVFIATVRV